jgi:glycerophosphoryl diester phosphodiesterase
VDFSIDVFEFDLHLTKDGVLVLLHDNEMDRTSDSVEVFGREHVRPEEMTFDELRKLNMGAKFVSDSGESPYADLHGEDVPDDLRIVSLSEALDYLESIGRYYYIIEIKNGGEIGFRAVDQLYSELKARDMVDRVAFGSFHGEVSEYKDKTYPDLMRGAFAGEVINFYLAAALNKQDYTPPCGILQLPFNDPEESKYINLGTARVINYAHAHNMAVQYWTVNDEKDMAYLLSLGVDCIMSDYPDRLWRVKQEMGLNP